MKNYMVIYTFKSAEMKAKFTKKVSSIEWNNFEEYKPVNPIRLENTVTNGVIIKGV